MIHRDALWILELRKAKVSKMTMKKSKTLHRFAAVAVVLLMLCLVLTAPATAEGVDGCQGSGSCTHVAAIGGVHYPTLYEAIAIANSLETNPTIVILNDDVISTAPTTRSDAMVSNEMTIDFQGHIISVTFPQGSSGEPIAGIHIGENGVLTLTDTSNDGNGGISTETCYALHVQDNGELIINSGNYRGSTTAVQVNVGSAIISGGHFSVTPYGGGSFAGNPTHRYLLNCIDSSFRDGTAQVIVTGGSFANYDPADSLSENPAGDFVPLGYISTVDEDTYTVTSAGVSCSDSSSCTHVASIDGVHYPTLYEAIAIANSLETNPTIVILNDDVISTAPTTRSDAMVSNEMTIDFQGHIISVTFPQGSSGEPIAGIHIGENGVLTLTDTSNDGNGGISTETCYALHVQDNGELIINSGNYRGSTTAVQVNVGSAIISGGHFSVTPYGGGSFAGNPTHRYLLNCIDSSFRDGTAQVIVTGGSFANYDPADSLSENPAGDFVPMGYQSVCDEDIVVYVVLPCEYTVILHPNGGSVIDESKNVTSHTYGAVTTLPSTGFIEKVGYSFTGWYPYQDGSGTVVTEIAADNMDDFILYANWTINQYTITFNTNGGTEIAPITQDYGTEINSPEDPTRDGYTFAGWDNNIPATMPASDMTITAQWTQNPAPEDDMPTQQPTERPTSGGATDTGSGNFAEYPRQADGTAGEISFGSSKDVKAVDLPEGVTGEVKLIAKSTHPAPEGKETHKVFEINIPNYPTGKAATIKFEMTLSDIEAKGLTAADVCLYHFNKETGLWEKLPTTFKVVDGKVYFEAVTTGFSPFAIVFEEGAATPAAGADEPVTPPTETPDVPETPGTLPPVDTPETPEQPTESPAPILAVLAGLGVAVVLRRK